MENLKVKVTEHRGILAIETLKPEEKDSEFHPAGGGSFGCVLGNSKRLGVSPEAMVLLKAIKRGSDGLGDPDIFGADDGTVVFGWIGGPLSIKHPGHCEGSRDYKPSLLEGVCQEIENVTAEGAIEAIDSQLDSEDE